MEQIHPHYFEKSDYLGYLKQVYRRFGVQAVYKQFRPTIRRPFSRKLIEKFAPTGVGLEIGVGNQTIAPMSRTVLADAYQEHVAIDSWAKVYFKSESIPFADNTFSFVLSEHMLEHVPNPLKVLTEWKRVIIGGGVYFLVPSLPRPNL